MRGPTEPPQCRHQPRSPAARDGRQQSRQKQQKQPAYIGVGADGRIERHGARALAHDARPAGDLSDTWRSVLNGMKRNAAARVCGEGGAEQASSRERVPEVRARMWVC
jgi:hypothetical protein